MMRSTGRLDSCAHCRTRTTFQREVTGPRGGHLRWEPCCVRCGEDPARRTGTFAQAVDIVRAGAGEKSTPLADRLHAQAEKIARGDAMLAATVGLPMPTYRVSPEQQLRDADHHDLQAWK
jgi:hypothetical protein